MVSLTTGRVAVVLLLVWALWEGRDYMSVFRTKAWIIFLPLPAVILQYIFVPDFGQLSRFLHLAIYSFLGGALVATLARDIGIVLRATLLAVSVQSLLLFFSFFSTEYRFWFDSIVFSGSNFDASYVYRAPGFSSAGGASLSVIQSFGMLVGWLLLRKNLFYERVIGNSRYLIFLAMIMATASCIVVGRTGLLMCCAFLIIFIFSVESRMHFGIFASLFLVSGFAFFGDSVSGLLANDFSSDYFTTWAFGMFSGEDDTLTTLSGQAIPSLTSETFFGTGLSNIVDGVNPSGNDSGFVQGYYSMGLPFAVLHYVAYLAALYHVLKWLPFKPRVAVCIILFAIELKEPFLFKYSTMMVIMALHFAHRREYLRQYRSVRRL
ncbi:hypothetical protein C7C56_009290 [Massilia glaciei]|uniref:O-antigen ligase domain-containing protein n=2 Tax=Massilia glaciei TaxID=1524097 RepID=A0A2U2HN69_9BURK|nr:hypothetical protein C7C56_009290 [Massilia glaciei]